VTKVIVLSNWTLARQVDEEVDKLNENLQTNPAVGHGPGEVDIRARVML
jgi:hypothetical protein